MKMHKDWRPYPWQEDTWQHINQLRNQNKLPHGILLSGDKGLGKLELAHGVAASLLCRAGGEYACGECKGCQLVMAGTHPDIMHIGLEEKSKQIKVDQIRRVIEFIAKTAQQDGAKVVVIEPAEALNINAANALLKCLEEPSGESYLLLVSHAPGRLLPTIRSRCQIIPVGKPEQQDADQWLVEYVPDAAQRHLLLLLANGNPLQAKAFSDEDIAGRYANMVQALGKLAQGDLSLVQYAESVNKQDPLTWLRLNQQMLWQLISHEVANTAIDQLGLDRFVQMTEKPGFSQRAYQLLDDVQQAIAEMQSPSNPNTQLLMESLLIRWQAFMRV